MIDDEKIKLIGHRRNYLTLISQAQKPKWWFRCHCGNVKSIEFANWYSGRIKSCGCMKMSKSRKSFNGSDKSKRKEG